MNLSFFLYLGFAVLIGSFGTSKFLNAQLLLKSNHSEKLNKIAKREKIFGVLVIVFAFIFVAFVVFLDFI